MPKFKYLIKNFKGVSTIITVEAPTASEALASIKEDFENLSSITFIN